MLMGQALLMGARGQLAAMVPTEGTHMAMPRCGPAAETQAGCGVESKFQPPRRVAGRHAGWQGGGLPGGGAACRAAGQRAGGGAACRAAGRHAGWRGGGMPGGGNSEDREAKRQLLRPRCILDTYSASSPPRSPPAILLALLPTLYCDCIYLYDFFLPPSPSQGAGRLVAPLSIQVDVTLVSPGGRPPARPAPT
jgi:hypothetical protein